MRKYCVVLLLLLLSFAVPAGAATVPYDLVSEVWIYEPRVTALVFEFDKPLACAFDLTGSVSVSAELKELKSYEGLPVPDSSWPMSPRKVIAAYTTDEPAPGKPVSGKYLIVELSDLDSNAASTYISLKRFTLEGAKEKGWNNGREILPYGENMVYDIKLNNPLKYADGTFTDAVTFQRRGERTLIAPRFVAGRYESPSTTLTVKVNNQEKAIKDVKYTLYSPPAPVEGKKYPLVVYLHGSSCRSIYEDGIDDVMTPVLTNQGAITWVKHGTPDCYVFVPQYEFATFPLVKEALLSILNDKSLAIDMNRVYVSGLSMGGMGSWELLADEKFAPYFAAALINCGYPCFDVGKVKFSEREVPTPELIAAIQKAMANGTKVWLVHSDTDPTVPVEGSFYGYKAMTGLEMAAEMPKPSSSNKNFTYWEALGGAARFTLVHCQLGKHNTQVGIYSLSPHEVYEYSYAEPMFIEWLFAQSK